MNTASLSTNFSMSQGHATRSTRGRSRVIHFTARTSQEKEQGCRAGEGRRQEHSSESQSRVAPDRLIRNGEKHAGVRTDEEAKHRADRAPYEARAAAQRAGDRTRRAEPSRLPDRAEERYEREESEDEECPRAEAHRGVGLEGETPATRVHEHVPEPDRLSEVERQEDRARDQCDEACDERDPRRAFVAPIAGEAQQRPEGVAPSRESSKEEVRDDPPLPLWRGREVLGGRHQCGGVALLFGTPFIRPLRKASRPAMSPTTAVATPPT